MAFRAATTSSTAPTIKCRAAISTNDDADVAKLQRAAAAGDEEARYDLAEYYISNGRYEEAEALGVLIEEERRRERLEVNEAKP